nr:response regulator [Pseudanabaena sp. FACHB-1998]
MILEDSETDRFTYIRYLEADAEASYRILTAETFEEGLSLYRSQKPDIILVDFSLPDGNGLDFLEAISPDVLGSNLSAIMLTGQGDERTAVKALKLGASDYLLKGDVTAVSLLTCVHQVRDRLALINQLQQSQQQQAVIAAMTLRIRQYINLEDISNAIVKELRNFLAADRVLIYRFNPDMSGMVVAEAIVPPWKPCINIQIHDNCFQGNLGEAYREGDFFIAADIYDANLSESQQQILERFQVRASLVMPILLTNDDQARLWGLLIVHQCSTPRQWAATDIQLLQQLSVHLAIALQQAELYDSLQNLNISLEQKIADRTQELQFQNQVLEKIHDGVVSTDLTGKILSWNQGIEKLFGYTAAEMIGQNIEIFYESKAYFHEKVIQPLLAHGTNEIEHIFKTRSGKQIYISLRLSVVRDQEGNIISLMGCSNDISDRKEAETKLHRTNEELIRATRLKDEFLANMSHELRTPLNAILGMSEALLEQIMGTLNPKQIQSINLIEKSGQHLLELINDILDLSKIASGTMELNLEATSVEKLCQSSLAFIRQQSFQKNIQIHSQIAPNIKDIIVDERRIKQSLINLLSNAVKFTPPNGKISLLVSISSDPNWQTNPNAPSPQSMILFQVKDTGIGIAPQDLSRLFQPFSQLDSSLNRQYEGTGLGLAMVKQITNLHGGTVDVQSQLGQGSCFTVALPYSAYPAIAAQPTDPKPSSPSLAIATEAINSSAIAPLVLLAEDNESNITTVTAYLSACNYRLIQAKNGQEAIKLAQIHNPDIILMDIQMPMMDGLEATRLIRANPQIAHIPIIALTALAMENDKANCLASGANDYMAKPIKLKQLHQKIQQMLNIAT